MAKNPSESLLARLKNVSRELGVTIEMAMRRYAHERLLNLLQSSEHSNAFCLKGGVLIGALIDGGATRPTDDIDFNGMDGGKSVTHLEAVLKDICGGHGGADGLRFDVSSMKVLKDRDGAVPGGKISMMAYIGKTRVPLRVDVGYGNAITPHVLTMEMPTILPGLVPPTTVAVYPMETTIAEKLHAMHRHGEFNTRIKDYFDIWQFALSFPFVGSDLASAVRNTFVQHGDEVPSAFAALGPDFSRSSAAQRQWRTFTQAARLGEDTGLDAVVEQIKEFINPVLEAVNSSVPPGDWQPGQGWSGKVLAAGPS